MRAGGQYAASALDALADEAELLQAGTSAALSGLGCALTWRAAKAERVEWLEKWPTRNCCWGKEAPGYDGKLAHEKLRLQGSTSAAFSGLGCMLDQKQS